MVFSSPVFLFCFLVITLSLYYIVPKKLKNTVLAITSLFFYAWVEPKYIFLMLLTVSSCYLLGILIEKASDNKIRKIYLVISIVLNIAILAYFKYANFIVDSYNEIAHLINGVSFSIKTIALPIGISFYTFQSLSYTIDVYRKKVKATYNWINFCAYVSMFPQLIAGPIVRYETVALQLESREESFEKFGQGVLIFTVGLAKKVFIANFVGSLWDEIQTMLVNNQITTVAAWIGMISFTLQIYFDFSGYSDMAIGMGKMLGIDFEINFNYPYISKSITEFWRRWHISLSTWFKEYVYIPLGGSKKGKLTTYRNLLIVWAITGLWHGASWNFVLWGLYYFVFLVIEKLCISREKLKNPANTNGIGAVIGHIYTPLIVGFGWIIFSFEDLSTIGIYFKALLGIGTTAFINDEIKYLVSNYAIFLICGMFFSTPVSKLWITWLKTSRKWLYYGLSIIFVLLTLIVSTACLVDGSYNPFLYFRF